MYDRDGILFPIPVLSPEDTAFFRNRFQVWSDAAGGRLDAHDMRYPHLFQGWAYDLATLPAVLDVVESVIGPDILVNSTTMFCKYPNDGSWVSWHQDGYYLGLSGLSYVTAWVALTDSSMDNGCMKVVRGSHRSGKIEHDRSGDLVPNNLLPSGMQVVCEIDQKDVCYVVLSPGEMSLHHSNIIHGSNPNLSSRPRLGFAIRYQAPDVRQQVATAPSVLARGTDRFGYYPLLKSRPGERDAQHAIRRQKALMRWVEQVRGGRPHEPLPEDAGLICA